MSDKYAGILERLEKAPFGEHELNGLVAEALGWTRGYRDHSIITGNPMPRIETWTDPSGKHVDLRPPEYTTSLDAALPGENIIEVTWLGNVGGHKGYRWSALNKGSDGCLTDGYAHTEVLARRIAVLRARQTIEDREGE